MTNKRAQHFIVLQHLGSAKS